MMVRLLWSRGVKPEKLEPFHKMEASPARARLASDGRRQYKHPQKRGLVTVAGKPRDDVTPGTQNSILKQAGFK